MVDKRKREIRKLMAVTGLNYTRAAHELERRRSKTTTPPSVCSDDQQPRYLPNEQAASKMVDMQGIMSRFGLPTFGWPKLDPAALIPKMVDMEALMPKLDPAALIPKMVDMEALMPKLDPAALIPKMVDMEALMPKLVNMESIVNGRLFGHP